MIGMRSSSATISEVSRAVLLTRGIAGFRALRFVPIGRLYPQAVGAGKGLMHSLNGTHTLR